MAADGAVETELKIVLDEAGAERLRRHPALAELRSAPGRTLALRSVYYDTGGHDLAAAGIALRVRKLGSRWVQTVKRRAAEGGGGLFAHLETERDAPGGRLALDGPDPDGAYAAIRDAVGDSPLAPVFETRVRRRVERLRAPEGTVELAIDEGEIVAGAARAPVLEAELELVEGGIGAIYALGRLLFAEGPVRFGELNKSERGYRLARGEPVEPPAGARRAGEAGYPPDAAVEIVARTVLRDCLGQIAANMALLAESTDPEAAHQLRVGLRRLRTACKIFGPSLGKAALAPLSEAAREIGREVGRLRDLDVLIEVVAGTATLGLDEAARATLLRALEARREVVRAEVRAGLAGLGATGFLFDLGAFIEGRGWLAPEDDGQPARLAAPIAEAAPGMLAKRWKTARKRGKRIETLDAAGLHALRKALKKLRYAVDALAPSWPGKRVRGYLAPLKELQDSFGSLNDAAMTRATLAGAGAPGAGDPDAQRAAGWVLGALAAAAGDDRARVVARWKALAEVKPFWP